MAEKAIVINGKLGSVTGKLNVAAKLEPGDYALRVFPEKSSQEIIYRSTRIGTLKKTDTGFECEAHPLCADQNLEIKNIKTNTIVVKGKVELVNEEPKVGHQPSAISGQPAAEEKPVKEKK
jgi:hypothetical protein